MSNLLKETLNAITLSHHDSTDVTFVGSSDGTEGMYWTQFTKDSDFNYNNRFGTQLIPADLIIQFNDGSHLERREYDGSEWWEYVAVKPKYIVENSAAISLQRMRNNGYGDFGEYEIVRV